MNVRDIRLLSTCIGGAFVVAAGAQQMYTIIQEERQKRLEIRKDMLLDIAAIRGAQMILQDRIERGEIRSLDELKQAIRVEIDFQKIAIRES